MKPSHTIQLLFMSALAASQAQTILQCDFSPAQSQTLKFEQRDGRDGGEILRDTDGSYMLHFALEQPERRCRSAYLPFDFTTARCKLLRMSVKMKYTDVTKPSMRWNGLKLMATYSTANTGIQYRNPSNGRYGNSDWTTVDFSFMVEPDAKPGRFDLGIQDSSGEVWFKDFRVELLPVEHIFPRYSDENYQATYTSRVTSDKPRRGVMSPSRFTPEILTKHLPDLKAWGANLLRWQLWPSPELKNGPQSPDKYLNWIIARLPEIRLVLDKCQELGIKVVLDLHATPGNVTPDGGMLMFEDATWADTFERTWILFAASFKGHPALYGYDLINEPRQNPRPVPFDYLGLQYRIAKRIRTIDPDTPIIIESDYGADAFTYSYLSPLPLPNIIYQVHTYFPGEYTHQKVFDKGGQFTAYPNTEHNWNKETHRAYLKTLRDFQLKHNAKIYVGEFSAARWAEGADRWLQDAIELFEEYGWDWTYHAFRESDTWSVEHTENYNESKLAPADTKRKIVLLNSFKLNK